MLHDCPSRTQPRRTTNLERIGTPLEQSGSASLDDTLQGLQTMVRSHNRSVERSSAGKLPLADEVTADFPESQSGATDSGVENFHHAAAIP